MMDGSSLNLIFESGPYEDTLNRKVEKDNEQFGISFVEETKKGSKSSKQSGSTNE